MTFEAAVEFVLRYEGGYVNDPEDPGGETNFGISKRAYPHLDIASLTRNDAIDIYHRDYWLAVKADDLPSGLDLLVFDSSVNQGVGTAAKLLQKSVGTATDGVIGPITIAAAAKTGVLPEFIAQRALHYALIPQVSHFGLGWYRRLAAAAELGFKEEAIP